MNQFWKGSGNQDGSKIHLKIVKKSIKILSPLLIANFQQICANIIPTWPQKLPKWPPRDPILNNIFVWFWGSRWLSGPSWGQDGPKSPPRSPQTASKTNFGPILIDFSLICYWFGIDFWSTSLHFLIDFVGCWLVGFVCPNNPRHGGGDGRRQLDIYIYIYIYGKPPSHELP